MIEIQIQVFGKKEVVKTLKDWSVSTRLKVIKAVNASAMRIRNTAIRKCPSGVSSALRQSIHPKFYASGEVATIGTSLHYAKYVEFGTGPYGQKTNKNPVLPTWYKYGSSQRMPIIRVGDKFAVVPALALWSKRKNVNPWYMAKMIAERGGVAGQPFLYPAFAEERPKFIRAIEKIIKDGPDKKEAVKGKK